MNWITVLYAFSLISFAGIVTLFVVLRTRKGQTALLNSYESLFQNIQSVVVQTNAQGLILNMNPYGETLLGYSLNELVGVSLENFCVVLDNNAVQESETHAKTGRTIWMRWNNYPLSDHKGKYLGTITVGTDITDSKWHEIKLEQLHLTIAHELRTPLVTISAFAGLLEEQIREKDLESLVKGVHFILHASKKMGALIDEFQEISRIGRTSNEHTRVLLAELVDDACALLSGVLMPKKVAMRLEAKSVWLTCDRPRLVEVFEHLIDNSAKFMGDQTEPRIEIGIALKDGFSTIYVRDNGAGIVSSYLERMFVLFEKYNPKSEGTGLGLTLVERIIKAHHGRIWAESEGLGKGTKVFFRIENMEVEDGKSE